MTVKLVPVREFEWTNDYSYNRTMTCVNHPTAIYSTKNPVFRSIGILRYPDGFDGECPCPFDDLRVMVTESGDDGKHGASFVVLRDGTWSAEDRG